MDYKSKYLKYKTKYLVLKNMKGGFDDTLLNLENKGIKTETGDGDIMCPANYPYLCTKNSNSIGLCKKSVEDCDKIDSESLRPLIKGDMSEDGKKFGYIDENLHVRCDVLEKVYEYTNDKFVKLDIKDISICTFNIMGIYRPGNDKDKKIFLDESFKIRADIIRDEILENQPTIICLQELSTNMYNNLYNDRMKEIYPYSYEQNFDSGKYKERDKEKFGKEKDIEVHIFSQIPAKSIELYKVKGNLNYTNSLIIADFENFTVFNCYLQAGSKKSAGQEKVWYHYSRCRQDELMEIVNLSNKYKNPIIVGDFNCDLNGPIDEWNELKPLKLKTFNEKDNNFIDSWFEKNSPDQGYTENTDTNHMRWNAKFIEKKLRYDAVLYGSKSALYPTKSKLIFNKGRELDNKRKLDDKTINELFRKFMVSNSNESNIKYFNNDKKTFEIFPSDHFGVMTTFQLN